MKRRAPFALLVATLLAFFGPPLLRGEVIYPHDNSLELGAPAIDGRAPDERSWTSLFSVRRAPISNRKFFDQSSLYVPEIEHHLNGDHKGWLSTWNPHVELGRPSFQMYGYGPAFPLTRALALFTDDAFTLYTWYVVVTLCLTAIFAFLFFRALDLDAWAAYLGATALGLGYVVLYWQTALMLPSGVCWTMAVLWLIARFVARPTFALGTGVAFACYALLMSAYPQQIVWHAYLLAAFTLWRLWPERTASSWPWKKAGLLAAALVLGGVASLPTYLDIVLQARASARLEVDPTFFLTLPEIHRPLDLALFFAKLYDAFWIGNPIFRGYQGKFNWLCLLPIVSTFVCLSFLDGGWRRARLWQCFALVCLVMTLWPASLLFGVRFLGLSLSPYVPMAAGMIPCVVVATITIDRVLRHGFTRPWLASAIVIALPSLSAIVHVRAGLELYPSYVAASIVLTGLMLAFVWRRGAAWIAALGILSTVVHGARLVLWRAPESIHQTSPLVEKVRELTHDGTRYAFVGGRKIELLPPNQEARLHTRSVHSYDPLSSRAFQGFVLRISESGPRTYGRQFKRIFSDAKLAGDDFTYCNIGAVLSVDDLTSPAVVERERVDDVRVYTPTRAPTFVAQLDVPSASRKFDSSAGIEVSGPLDAQPKLPVETLEAHDDALTVRLTRADHPTLLFVSHQFHPHWVARASGAKLRTLDVNRFFQGVIVPPGTEEVELTFEPFVRWSHVPQWIFAALAAALVGASLRRKVSAR